MVPVENWRKTKEKHEWDEMDGHNQSHHSFHFQKEQWLFCDSVSLTGLGLISTLEIDYAWEVVKHSISDVTKRQKYSPDVCPSFYLLKTIVHEILMESKSSLYLVVSMTAQWL